MPSRCLLALLVTGVCLAMHAAEPVAAPPPTAPPPAPRTLVVAMGNPAAADTNPGTAAQPLRSIGAAAALAQPGDTVLVHAGVYRERVTPARGGTAGQPIVYRAAPGEAVVVKGSEPWRDWAPYAPDAPDVFVTTLTGRLHEPVNPYLTGISIGPKDEHRVARPAPADAPLPKTLGQLFVDGQPLVQADAVATVPRQPGTWVVTPDGTQILAHFAFGPGGAPDAAALATHLIELTVRDRLFAPQRRGLTDIEVRGFVFEHCANQGPFPQGGAVSPRSGHRWVIAGNTIRWAATVGLDIGGETWDLKTLAVADEADRQRLSGGPHLITHNTISDNGLCGIAGWNAGGSVISDNVIERNNWQDFAGGYDATWEEWGGIKLHGQPVRIEGNVIRDNEGFGIWLDNGYTGTRVTRNLIVNNRLAGVFVELGVGPCLIDTNIIAYTRPRGLYYSGMGIYTHDASGVTIAHNLILGNAGCGLTMRTTSQRKVGEQLVETSHEVIRNNILWDNSQAAINLPYPNERARANTSDYNLLAGTQEFWQGLSEPWRNLFAVNTFVSSVKPADLTAELAARLTAAQLPRESWPDLQYWPHHPVLSLAHWRLLTQQDTHSKEDPGALKLLLRPRAGTLSVKAAAGWQDLRGPPVAGVDCDFFGVPLIPGEVHAGPFQSLTSADQLLLLFPVLHPPTELPAP